MITNTSINSGRRLAIRLTILALASAVLVLEIIFSFFVIPEKAVAPFNLMGLMAALILIGARPKMFQLILRARFGRLPLIYKLCAIASLYVLVIKSAYFLGYLASAVFKY